jgi:hypothetical protein
LGDDALSDIHSIGVSNGLLTKLVVSGRLRSASSCAVEGSIVDQPHKIAVLRAETCLEGDTCAMIARLTGDPETLYMVVRPETDPTKIAAFASRVGPEELLAKFPARLPPEVS